MATAPAKLILCGEHAVVYGRPAIALPLSDLRASATVKPALAGNGPIINAPDLGGRWRVADRPDEPLSGLIMALIDRFGVPANIEITIRSSIPIASGMGSGAAIATAITRELLAYCGQSLPAATISELVYESERGYHGTPSGIDNTVVAFEQPIWFQRRTVPPHLIEPLPIGAPLTLVVGDTGVRSPTRLPVGAVRERWQADPDRYEVLFDQVAELVRQARVALAEGNALKLGPLLDANHELLREIGVSSPELDRLTAAARAVGALGAKLAGAGWGGVMLALTVPEQAESVAAALRAAGAVNAFITTIAAVAFP
ncbi:mevalonate kinase [Chloroflexus sp.]|uniref:mevalonate kinase n=1 Tax=Chloroflexus sp. TaxID=1904827 RepID=UPI0026349F2F|nr:mevalonate kinase [uncultured Chloroflexus sp.]